MKQRTLGETGIQVSQLALGGLFTSSFGPGLEQTRRAVRRDSPPRYHIQSRARGGDRTRTSRRRGGFKPPVSANSTTRAGEQDQAIRLGDRG
jgi:hypothetical protein